MGTLYIDRKGIELRHEGACMLFYEQGRQTGSVPFSHLERVVVFNRARLDTGLLSAFVHHGVSLVVLHARFPGRTAQLVGNSHNETRRRVAQYRMTLDEAWRMRWSRMLVRRKLHGQRALLVRAMKARPGTRHALFGAVKQLDERLVSLGGQTTRSAIRGVEGAGASAYFRGYCTLFAPELDFTGRNRRPPRDPVNACLSLAYTLLHSEAVSACHVAGLDPMLGVYHDVSFARESLACDLVEPLRPRVDDWVWSLFRKRILYRHHFSDNRGACLLGKAGRRLFYTEWEAALPRFRRRTRAYARLLLHALINAGLDEMP